VTQEFFWEILEHRLHSGLFLFRDWSTESLPVRTLYE
jgi:hypothetical protein